jgi:epoxyqueuosine reductase
VPREGCASLLDHLDLSRLATEEGLDIVGSVPVGPSPGWHAYREWLGRGYAGEMAYLARAEAVDRRRDPRALMPDARTVLVVGASYAGPATPSLPPLNGRVSRFAWGRDYHDWLLARLKRLVARIERSSATSISARCYVDTGPILERGWAQAARLGWGGKNTTLIHPHLGSFLFLGVALLSLELPAYDPSARTLPTCGSCTACLEACPTGALVAPGVLDARRCLSYLTIEKRGAIPEALRSSLGERVFGCDTCQDVCPWNRKALRQLRDEAAPESAALYLPDLLTIDEEVFRLQFRRSPVWRATPVGLARNAAVVMGNLGDAAARPHLDMAAMEHPNVLVREHAAWALRQLS